MTALLTACLLLAVGAVASAAAVFAAAWGRSHSWDGAPRTTTAFDALLQGGTSGP